MENDAPTSSAPQPGDAATRAATVAEKTARDKIALVEQLRKTPVIQIACERVGVSRMSFYRWKKDDEEFAKVADDALADGKSFCNDLAESQLLSALKDGEAWSVQYWLRHHHADYSNKLEITAKASPETLTPDQQEAVDRALELAGVLTPPPPDDSGTPFISSPQPTHGPNE